MTLVALGGPNVELFSSICDGFDGPANVFRFDAKASTNSCDGSLPGQFGEDAVLMRRQGLFESGNKDTAEPMRQGRSREVL